MKKLLQRYLLHIAWIQALLATAGSLYFSEIMELPPCVLCWYQRIFMYPLVAIILIGILRKDKGIHLYVLPLSIPGFCIALYHNLLYYKIIPEAITPCTFGISCTTKYFEWFGFVTIPFLSLAVFGIITICMVIFKDLADKD